jgi:hypothetical protein
VHRLNVYGGELEVDSSYPVEPAQPYPPARLGWTFAAYPQYSPLHFYWDFDLVPRKVRHYNTGRLPMAGFFVGSSKDVYDDETSVLMPLWFVVSLFAILPLAAGMRHVRRRRHAQQ